MNADLLRETEDFLHAQIPLTRAMGVVLESYDGQRLVLGAPLEPNHNHLATAFGGSLSALCTLSGYTLLWLLLGDRRAHIVIRESRISYLRPVRGTLRAICQRPEAAVWERFQAAFGAAGKARLTLQVRVEDAGRVCVEFEGEFVALR